MIVLISSLLYHLYAHIQAKPLGRKTRHTSANLLSFYVETWEFLFKAIIVASKLKYKTCLDPIGSFSSALLNCFFLIVHLSCFMFMLSWHLHPTVYLSLSLLRHKTEYLLHRDYCFLMRLGKATADYNCNKASSFSNSSYKAG